MAKSRTGTAIAYVLADDVDEAGSRRRITRWATGRGARIVLWEEDAGVPIDATLRDRPGLLAAIAAISTSGASYVVAERADLFGDSLAAAMVDRLVRRAGAELVVLDGVPDRGHARFVEAFAEYEHALLSTRMRATWKASRERGERLGTVPWGYRRTEGGELAPDEVEQNVIGVVRHMRTQGWTIQEIVEFLRKTGVRGRGGKPLGTTRVFEIIHGARKKGAAKSVAPPPSPGSTRTRARTRTRTRTPSA